MTERIQAIMSYNQYTKIYVYFLAVRQKKWAKIKISNDKSKYKVLFFESQSL